MNKFKNIKMLKFLLIFGIILTSLGLSSNLLKANEVHTVKTARNKLSYVTLHDGTKFDTYMKTSSSGEFVYSLNIPDETPNGTYQSSDNLNFGYTYLMYTPIEGFTDDVEYYIRQLAIYAFKNGIDLQGATSTEPGIIQKVNELLLGAEEQRETNPNQRSGTFTRYGTNGLMVDPHTYMPIGYKVQGVLHSATVSFNNDYYAVDFDNSTITSLNVNDLRFIPQCPGNGMDGIGTVVFNFASAYNNVISDGDNDLLTGRLLGKSTVTDTFNLTHGGMTTEYITRIDAVTGSPLGGFGVIRANSGHTYVSFPDGTVQVSTDESSFQDIIAPNNYQIESKSLMHSCHISHPSPIQKGGVVHNEFVYDLFIHNLQDRTNNPIVGAQFVVKDNTGKTIGTYTTGSDGRTPAIRVIPGTYTIEEISRPGKLLSLKSPMTVSMSANKTVTLKAPLPEIPVNINAHEKNSPSTKLGGVEFTINPGNKKVNTNGQGVASLRLTPGNYTVTNSRKPQNYEQNNTPQTIVINETDPTSVTKSLTFQFTPETKKVTITHVDDLNQPIVGAQFSVNNGGGNHTTDRNGQFSVMLRKGTYTFTKTSVPPQYKVLEPSFNITVVGNENSTITKTTRDKLVRGDIKIVNTDSLSNTPIVGSKFELFKGGVSQGTATTNQNGEAYFRGLLYGDYIVKEKEHLIQYHPNETEHTANIRTDGQVITLDHKSQPIVADINVNVKNEETNENLEGTVIGLYQNDRLLEQKTTNSDGNVTFEDKRYGDYVVKQITPTEGFLLRETEHRVQIRNTDAKNITYTNKPIRADIHLRLVNMDNEESIDGSTFSLYKEDTKVEEHTTNEKGEIIFRSVLYGDYTIKQENSNVKFNKAENVVDVSIRDTNPKNINFSNKLVRADVMVSVKDSETNEPVNGSKFVLLQNGIMLQESTSYDGVASFNNVMHGNYTVKQIGAPLGYTVSDEEHSISVTKNGVIELEYTNNIKQENLTIYTKDTSSKKGVEGFVIALLKNGEQVTELVTDVNGKVTFTNLDLGIYNVKVTSPAVNYNHPTQTLTIDLISDTERSKTINVDKVKSNVIVNVLDRETKQGVKGLEYGIFSNGKLVGTSISDDTGRLKFYKLPLGDYIVKQIKTTNQYIISTDEIPITVNTKSYSKQTRYVDPIYSTISVRVKDDFRGKFIEGVKIGLYDNQRNLITASITDNRGFVEFNNIRYGNYFVKQMEVPEKLKLNETEHFIEVRDSNKKNISYTNSYQSGSHRLPVMNENNEPILTPLKLVDKDTGNEVEINEIKDNIIETPTLPNGNYELKGENIENSSTIVLDNNTENKIVLNSDNKYKVVYSDKPVANTTFKIKDAGINVTSDNDGYVNIPKEYANTVVLESINSGVQSALQEDKTIVFTENPNVGSIVLNSQEKSEQVFVLEDINGNTTDVYTDKNGTATVNDLPYGEYTITSKIIPSKFNKYNSKINLDRDMLTHNVNLVEKKLDIKINSNIELESLTIDGKEVKDINTDLKLPYGNYDISYTPKDNDYKSNMTPIKLEVTEGTNVLDINAKKKTSNIVLYNKFEGTQEPAKDSVVTVVNDKNEIVAKAKTDEEGKVNLELDNGKYNVRTNNNELELVVNSEDTSSQINKAIETKNDTTIKIPNVIKYSILCVMLIGTVALSYKKVKK